MKKLLWLLACLPLIVHSQEVKTGIGFNRSLTWRQIQEQAKQENKYIFLDCYATWCGPCKQMDEEVFTKLGVAKFIEERFIVAKVQMDKTSADNDDIKKWYADAESFQSLYAVTAFPTYLFFNPDGKIVHKAIGFMDAEKFIDEAKNSLMPANQYFTVLAKYKEGKLGIS